MYLETLSEGRSRMAGIYHPLLETIFLFGGCSSSKPCGDGPTNSTFGTVVSYSVSYGVSLLPTNLPVNQPTLSPVAIFSDIPELDYQNTE